MDEYQKAFNFILGASYMLISIFYFRFSGCRKHIIELLKFVATDRNLLMCRKTTINWYGFLFCFYFKILK